MTRKGPGQHVIPNDPRPQPQDAIPTAPPRGDVVMHWEVRAGGKRDACPCRIGVDHARGVDDELARLLDELAEDTDDNPCWYDHHGRCQAHNGWSEVSGQCTDRDAHELLKRLGVR